jgi:hypothetical protein
VQTINDNWQPSKNFYYAKNTMAKFVISPEDMSAAKTGVVVAAAGNTTID